MIFGNWFFNINNPFIISLLIIIIVFAVITIFIKFIFVPLKIEHIKDKQALELKNTRMMALFAELDPDPVFRIDKFGRIIHFNQSASDILKGKSPDSLWNEIFSEIDLNFSDLIENDKSFTINLPIEEKHYSVYINGISYLEIAQVYFRDISERVKSEEQSKKYQEELKRLASHLETKLETERQRISRELHDGVGQNLLFLKLKLQQTLKGNLFHEPDKNLLDEMLEKSINELKGISYNLKPRILEEAGLAAALSSLAEKITIQTGIAGKIDTAVEVKRMTSELETALFRTAQEAFNNIIKHSQAKNFYVQVIKKNNSFRMLISDDGIGLTKSKITNGNNSGMGLLNMKERIANFNGSVKIDSQKGAGTVIIIEIPEVENYETR